MERRSTEALRNQFLSTFHMIKVLVDVCPDDIWMTRYHDVPFWHQVFHFVIFIEYWLREAYDGSEYRSILFDERIDREIDAVIPEDISVSRAEMQEYLDRIRMKVERFFKALDDEKLGEPIEPGNLQYTYTDVIVGQIRHIMYNIGYLNGILREKDLPESDWYSYNEEEGS